MHDKQEPPPASGPDSTRPSSEKPVDSHLETASEKQETGNTVTGSKEGGLIRALSNRKVQLVATGGSIGTALFLNSGKVLFEAGPANLVLGFSVYSCFMLLMNNCMAEMTVYMPVSGGFIRMAGYWADDALGFCAGWNFFLYQAAVIPFETTALAMILSYWGDEAVIPSICVCIVLYFFLNVYAVSWYGEAEFWLSSGKISLLAMLCFFTIATMCGGNPDGDAYGFRFWNDPGAFKEFSSTGDTGRFEGFLVALWLASFTVVGPEYISLMAAEAKHPRTYLKTAFKFVYPRIWLFYVVGVLCVGILVSSNDPTLATLYNAGEGNTGSAAASPFIIAMNRMRIKVFPDFVTALIATTIFTCGNSYVFYATRSLYGLSLEGRAPKIFRKCTKKGIPIYCFSAVMLLPFLAFLQLSNGSAQVLTWFTNLATGATVIDYIMICITYICFHRACKAQGFDRSKLPYCGWFQPWCGYIGLAWELVIITCYGYKSLRPFDASGFVTAYTMPIIAPFLFVGWKVLKGTKWLRPEEVDLIWQAPQITAEEEALEEPPIGFLRDCWRFIRGKDAKDHFEGHA